MFLFSKRVAHCYPALTRFVKFRHSFNMSTQKSKIPLKHYDVAVSEMAKAYQLAKDTGVSSEVLSSMEKALELAQHKDEFLENTSSKDSEGCARLLVESYSHDWEGACKQEKTDCVLSPRMVSGTLEGQFLKSFVSIHKAKKVLEIGMFTGFGALSMAEGLPADGQLVTVDIRPYLRDVVQPLLDQYPHGKKVKIEIGDALEVMNKLASSGEKFDVIFLDADKSMYVDCLKICFQDNLLAPNGTVVVDNAFQHGKAYNPDDGPTVAKEFAAYVASREDLHKVVIPMRDGVYMIRRLSEVEGGVAQ